MSDNSVYWLTVPPHDGWLVVPLEGKLLVSLIASAPDRSFTSLKVAGYHMGETKWIGEHQNIIAIKIEAIPNSMRNEMMPKIRNALNEEYKDTKILFLDDSYLLGKKKQ